MQLTFHNNDRSSHTLTVDGLTTVAQVCDQLVQCNHATHSPHWTVVERLGRYQLGLSSLFLNLCILLVRKVVFSSYRW